VSSDWHGVIVGEGNLVGKGVYAARDLATGEIVIVYDLAPLTREDFDCLPEGEIFSCIRTAGGAGSIRHQPVG